MKEVALSVLKEALLLFTTSDLNDVPSMEGHLRQSWIQFNPSDLMEILLSPHDRKLRGLVNSSWICIDRNSQQAVSLGVRQKSTNVNCLCGEVIDTYLFLTPVPGLVHTCTGAVNSEKDV